MSALTYCAECGAANEAGAVFCENCGKRLEAEATPQRPAEAPPQPYAPPSAQHYAEARPHRNAEAPPPLHAATPVQHQSEAPAQPADVIAPPVRARRPMVWIGSAAGLVVVLAGAAFAYQGSLSRLLSVVSQRVMPNASVSADSAAALGEIPIALGDTALREPVVAGDSAPVLAASVQPPLPPGATEVTVTRVDPGAEKKAVATTAVVPTVPAAPPPNRSTNAAAVPPVPPGTAVTTRGSDGITVSMPAKDSAVFAIPATTRENGTTARPAAAPAARIAVGSELLLKSLDKICTDKNKEGDRFRASVDKQVDGIGGASIPKGAIVTFVVDRLRRPPANATLEFTVAAESIELDGSAHPLSASTDGVTVKKTGNALKGALLGALVGAAATKAAGGDVTQAATGGAVGAAAGAAAGSQVKNSDGCIEKNAALRLTLKSDFSKRSN